MQDTMATSTAGNGVGVETTHDRAGKYLVFTLGKEEFGLQVLKIREIMGVQEITTVPQTEHYVKGVINLRGRVIPVIDLRLKFGMDDAEYTARTCVIVTEMLVGTHMRQMGLVVDGVSEVMAITAEEIENTPEFGDYSGHTHILGMAKIKGKVKILLDIDRVFGNSELFSLESAL